MMKKALLGMFLVFVITGMYVTRAAALQEVNSLKYISSIDVVVENIQDEQTLGITADELKTQIQSVLKRNGIVLNPEASEFLYLNVNPVCDTGMGVCAMNIRIAFEQLVIVSASQEACYGITWESAYATLVPINDAADTVVELTMEQLNAFITAYLEVN